MDIHIYWLVAVSFQGGIVAVPAGPIMFQNRTYGSEESYPLRTNNNQSTAQNMTNYILSAQIRRSYDSYHPLSPERNASYNPNLGYEPYWPGGEHVFVRLPSNDTANDRINKTMCGSDCPTLFQKYGPVCGMNKHFVYKNFLTVCQLRNEDCTNDAVWTIVYRGKCKNTFVTYPVWSWNMKSRAHKYIRDFLNRSLPTVDYKKEEWLQNIGSREYIYAINNPPINRRAVRNNLLDRGHTRIAPIRNLHPTAPTMIRRK